MIHMGPFYKKFKNKNVVMSLIVFKSIIILLANREDGLLVSGGN
jgi:hypothetical protein